MTKNGNIANKEAKQALKKLHKLDEERKRVALKKAMDKLLCTMMLGNLPKILKEIQALVVKIDEVIEVLEKKAEITKDILPQLFNPTISQIKEFTKRKELYIKKAESLVELVREDE